MAYSCTGGLDNDRLALTRVESSGLPPPPPSHDSASVGPHAVCGSAIVNITAASDLLLYRVFFQLTAKEMVLRFPHRIEDVEETKNKEIKDHFTGHGDGCVLVGEHKYCLNKVYSDHAEKYYNVEIKEDDIWVVTFPRSGTTWTQEMVWLIMNDLDFEKAQATKPWERVKFIDVPVLFSDDFVRRSKELNKDSPKALESIGNFQEPAYEKIKEDPSPRIIKSHLPFSLLPVDLLDKAKRNSNKYEILSLPVSAPRIIRSVIYVARNPKDVAVSYYYHNVVGGVHGFEGSFEKYWEFFENGLVIYGPQFPHVKEAWNLRNNPNLLFLFYEDIHKDLPGNIRKVSTFLNKSFSDDQVEKLANYLNFDNMKSVTRMGPKKEDKDAVIGLFKPGPDFFRRGKVGGNPEYTAELRARADKWILEQSKLYGVNFPDNN